MVSCDSEWYYFLAMQLSCRMRGQRGEDSIMKWGKLRLVCGGGTKDVACAFNVIICLKQCHAIGIQKIRLLS